MVLNYPKAKSYCDALDQAFHDKTVNWNVYEKKALSKIVKGCKLSYKQPGISEKYFKTWNHGSGRAWQAKGSKIVFLTHESSSGFNIGRA